MTVRIHGVSPGSPSSQVHRRTIHSSNRPAQETIYGRPTTHRQNGQNAQSAQAPSSPSTFQRASQKEALNRLPERASSPSLPSNAVFPGQVRSSSRALEQSESDRLGYSSPPQSSLGFSRSAGQLSPHGSPYASPHMSPHMSPQVPVNFSMVSTPALPAEQKLQPTTIQVAKSGQNTYIKPILGRRYVPQDFGNHYQFEPKETTRLRATNQQTNTAAANTAATPFTHNLKSSSSASHFQDSVRERSWDREDPFYKLRQEIQMQCKMHTDMVRVEVAALCQETLQEMGRRLQDAIERMQSAHDEETLQVRSMMHALDISHGEVKESSKPELTVDLEAFRQELEAERVCRRDRISEVHERINEEMSRITKLIDGNRTATLEALAQEHSERSKDIEELKATLSSASYEAAQTKVSNAEAKGMMQELNGDPEDMYTLYEMAREALGDTVHLRQSLAEERADRMQDFSSTRQQLDVLSREINTIQVLLREATAGRKEAR